MAFKCPQCGKPAQPKTRPFCSRYCKDKDLINWLDGRYVVPGASGTVQEGDAEDALVPEDELTEERTE